MFRGEQLSWAELESPAIFGKNWGHSAGLNHMSPIHPPTQVQSTCVYISLRNSTPFSLTHPPSFFFNSKSSSISFCEKKRWQLRESLLKRRSRSSSSAGRYVINLASMRLHYSSSGYTEPSLCPCKETLHCCASRQQTWYYPNLIPIRYPRKEAMEDPH